jgi:hypothetical protein
MQPSAITTMRREAKSAEPVGVRSRNRIANARRVPSCRELFQDLNEVDSKAGGVVRVASVEGNSDEA